MCNSPCLRAINPIPTEGSFLYLPSSGGAGKGSLFRGGVRATEKEGKNDKPCKATD